MACVRQVARGIRRLAASTAQMIPGADAQLYGRCESLGMTRAVI